MVVSMKEQDKASLDWIRVLLEELDRRSVGYALYGDYYSGKQGSRFVASGYRDLFTQAFLYYRENVCETVIGTVEERLDVDGFRFPSAGGADAAVATDPDAWRIWQDNGLDARSQVGHVEAMVRGLIYVLVSPFTSERVGPDKRSPRITIEQPTQCIVATSPGGRDRIVGLKTWYDATTVRRYVTLYYPDRIEKFEAAGREWANQHSRGYVETGGWIRRIVPGESWPLRHDLGVVPLVPLVNHPRLGEGLWAGIEGESDLKDIVPIQDAINFLALNGIIASDKAAFPQKWATGVEIPTVIKDGKTVASAAWQPDIDTILSTRTPDAKFGNFDVAELTQYDGTIKGKLAEVALIARIPIANFIPQTGQPASGEAREAAEIGLTKKAQRKQRHFGEGWEEVLRLSFRQLGDSERAEDTACEAVWASASVEPSAGKVDALVKERSLNVPLQVIWERLGHSATARAKFRQMLEDERKWMNSTPVATTQPDAVPAPDTQADPQETPPNGGNLVDTQGGSIQDA